VGERSSRWKGRTLLLRWDYEEDKPIRGGSRGVKRWAARGFGPVAGDRCDFRMKALSHWSVASGWFKVPVAWNYFSGLECSGGWPANTFLIIQRIIQLSD
jgi:hypothetical protein